MTQTAGKWLTQAEAASIAQRAHTQALKTVCPPFASMQPEFDKSKEQPFQRVLTGVRKQLESFRRACNAQRKLPLCIYSEFKFRSAANNRFLSTPRLYKSKAREHEYRSKA